MDLSSNYRGILLSFLIGGASVVFVTVFTGLISGIILALLLGMLVGNVFKVPKSFSPGIGYTSSKLLELSILFLAFSINYTHIGELGTSSLSIVLIMVPLMLVLTYLLARKMHCPGSTGWLVGFGTAICGSSAIAALAPSVAKNKEDVGVAMAVINLMGSIGMIALPFILEFIPIDATQAGTVIGGSLHSVGNVAGASYALSDSVGETAITVKLARVAMLSPGLILMNYLVKRNEAKGWRNYLKLPWYLWSFILITILSSVFSFPEWFLDIMHTGGKIILTVAMAAIGLKISFKQLIQSGKKGLLFGVIIFAIQLIILATLMFLVSYIS